MKGRFNFVCSLRLFEHIQANVVGKKRKGKTIDSFEQVVQIALNWSVHPKTRFPLSLGKVTRRRKVISIDVESLSWIRDRVKYGKRSKVVERIVLNWLHQHEWIKADSLTRIGVAA